MMVDVRVVSAVIEHIFSLPYGIGRMCWRAAAEVIDPPPVWVIGRAPATVALIDSEIVVVTLLAINNISHDGTMLYA